MAAPTLTLLNHTVIDLAESVTNWTKFDTLDTDIKKEGSNGITGTFRADGTEGDCNYGSAPVTAVGKTFRGWINTTNVPYMQPESSNGYEFSVYDGSTTEYKVMFGSDTYFGGWFPIIWDMDEFTTLTLANVEQWGIRVNHTGNSKNVDNVWVDGFRYLDGYSFTGGTSGDEVTLATIEEADRGTTTLYGYGIVTEFGGVYYATGTIQVGTGATTTWFEMDGNVLIFLDANVAAGLYELSGVGSGTRVNITGSVIQSAGSTDATRFVVDFTDSGLLACTFTDNLVVRASTVAFKSGQTATGNTFSDCGQITHGGADLSGCTVKGYEGTANTSALVYNVNADPDGELDDSSFTMGTAETHAIEFGTTSPLSMTLRGVDFSGYDSSTPNQNDSPIHVKRTSGTVTIDLIGCSGIGEDGYRTDGATVVLQASVILTVTVKDKDGNGIVDVQTAIYKQSDDTELMNEDTIAGGIATQGYNYDTDTDVYIRARKSSIGTTRYVSVVAAGQITATGLDVTITMEEEPIS